MARTGSTAGRNEVDVLVFATAPATVTITVGGLSEAPKSVPAGVSRVQAPMRNGAVSAVMTRSGATVLNTAVTSPFQINLNSQLVQDMEYRRASSLPHSRSV
jgi:hypothetical protein